MKPFVSILLLCCAVCCKTPDRDELIVQSPVLAGILVGGEHPKDIRFFELPHSDTDAIIPRNATISISSENAEVESLNLEGGVYATQEGYLLQHDSVYKLTVVDLATTHTLSAETRIPPAILSTFLTDDTVHISSPENFAGVLQWTSLDDSKYSYVVKLENVEDMKVEIPIEGGQFSSRFSGPQLESQLILQKTDFQFFGRHLLRVYAIDREFESVFFFDAADFRGFLRNGPDNVNGGKGFVSGVSTFSVEIFIEN